MNESDFVLTWKFFHRQNSLSLIGGNEFTAGKKPPSQSRRGFNYLCFSFNEDPDSFLLHKNPTSSSEMGLFNCPLSKPFNLLTTHSGIG